MVLSPAKPFRALFVCLRYFTFKFLFHRGRGFFHYKIFSLLPHTSFFFSMFSCVHLFQKLMWALEEPMLFLFDGENLELIVDLFASVTSQLRSECKFVLDLLLLAKIWGGKIYFL